jgi:hypothetical protein
MATNAGRNVSTGSNDRSTGRRGESKSYQPPTLVKRVILSTVTASIGGVSVNQSGT